METIQITKLTPEELYKGFKEIVKNLEERLTSQFQPKEPIELLTREETSNLLKVNLSTLYLWTKKGRLKAHSIGNRVYYKRAEVMNSIIELKY